MITEKAMLAAVHISIWTAVKHDRKVSRDVADQHGAHQGAGRYNKQLLRGADKLDELRMLAGQIRQTSRLTLRSCFTAVQILMWTAASIAFSVIIEEPPGIPPRSERTPGYG